LYSVHSVLSAAFKCERKTLLPWLL